MRSVIAVFAALALLAACGGGAGTFDDDPDNWRRTFGVEQPPDVEIVHSHYWRSPHFTLEFEAFFHFRADEELRAGLFDSNPLTRIEGEAARKSMTHFFHEKPAWFAPGDPDDYEVWCVGDGSFGGLRVFIQRATGDLFVTDGVV